VTQFLTEDLGLSESQKLVWYHHWITEGFSGLETRLEKLGSNGRYCFGSTPTLADICLIPQVYNAQRFDCPMDKYPLINGIWAHCMSKPEFIQASPETQPDHPTNL
jgi:maleylpyruvate isomerase